MNEQTVRSTGPGNAEARLGDRLKIVLEATGKILSELDGIQAELAGLAWHPTVRTCARNWSRLDRTSSTAGTSSRSWPGSLPGLRSYRDTGLLPVGQSLSRRRVERKWLQGVPSAVPR